MTHNFYILIISHIVYIIILLLFLFYSTLRHSSHLLISAIAFCFILFTCDWLIFISNDICVSFFLNLYFSSNKVLYHSSSMYCKLYSSIELSSCIFSISSFISFSSLSPLDNFLFNFKSVILITSLSAQLVPSGELLYLFLQILDYDFLFQY